MAALVDRWSKKWSDLDVGWKTNIHRVKSPQQINELITRLVTERVQANRNQIFKELDEFPGGDKNSLSPNQIITLLDKFTFDQRKTNGQEDKLISSYGLMHSIHLRCLDQFKQEDKADRREKWRLFWFRIGTTISIAVILLALGYVSGKYGITLPGIRLQTG